MSDWNNVGVCRTCKTVIFQRVAIWRHLSSGLTMCYPSNPRAEPIPDSDLRDMTCTCGELLYKHAENSGGRLRCHINGCPSFTLKDQA